MNLLIDTNVILNMVFKREGYEDAIALFKKIKKGRHIAFVTASSVTDEDIMDAFVKRWKDFEDCVQYMSAKNNQMDYVVTVNVKDFNVDSGLVVTPSECAEFLDKN